MLKAFLFLVGILLFTTHVVAGRKEQALTLEEEENDNEQEQCKRNNLANNNPLKVYADTLAEKAAEAAMKKKEAISGLVGSSMSIGSSLTGTAVGEIMSSNAKHHIVIGGTIENFSRFPLVRTKCKNTDGYINKALRTVFPSSKEAWASHQGMATTGSEVLCTMELAASKENEEVDNVIRFKYLAPNNFNTQSGNRLWLDVCERSDTEKCDIESLERQIATTDEENAVTNTDKPIKFKEFYYKIDEMVECDGLLCLVGKMGSAHKSELFISVFAGSLGDASDKIQENFKEADKDDDDYDDYLQSITTPYDKRQRRKKIKRDWIPEEPITEVAGSKRTFGLAELAFVASVVDAAVSISTSIGEATVAALMDQSWSISVGGQIENYSKFDLVKANCYNQEGYINKPLRQIASGNKEGWASHQSSKNEGNFVHCKMRVSGTEVLRNEVGETPTEGIMIHFMYSAPNSFVIYRNKLTVAVCSENDAECRSLDHEKMYNIPEGLTQYMKDHSRTREYYHESKDIFVCPTIKGIRSPVCVVGNMGSSHQPIINLNVYAGHLKGSMGNITTAFEQSGKSKADQEGSYQALLKSFESTDQPSWFNGGKRRSEL